MTARPVPEPLQQDGLQPVWRTARQRLDRFGPERRGAIARPDLDPDADLALKTLLGARLTKRLDLAQLEAALVARHIGEDLSGALTRLGHPPSAEAARRRARRARSDSARAALRRAAACWDEPWAVEWADSIIGAGLLGGLDGSEVEGLARSVRRLLDRLEHVELPGASRTELAAELFGSSHALDQGTKLAGLASRALRHRIGEPIEGRELWEASGILADRVSAPVLTWRVPAAGDSPLDHAIRVSARGALPLHISLLAMRRHPVTVPRGTSVLVVENPRLVEAAAERNLLSCVVSSNGNPTTAVTTLLLQTQDSGARLWYHGDFDAPGIAICRRMHELGCQPWMMNAGDYEDAISLAVRNGVRLEQDTRRCGPTPWDPGLEAAFDDHRLIVHEEFVLNHVLGRFCPMASTPPAAITGQLNPTLASRK